MPFVWRDAPENPDLLWLAEGFAERVAADQLDEAWLWADAALDVFHGGYAQVPRTDGGCEALTRQAKYCSYPAVPGIKACAMHARLIKRYEDKADA